VLDEALVPTSGFVADNALVYDQAGMAGRLRANARSFESLAASRLAVSAFGDAIYANMILLGFAWQRGLIPLARGAILRAIELNGVAVTANKRAFALGQQAAAQPEQVLARLEPSRPAPAKSLGDIIAIRAAHLAAYQDDAYAARYLAFVERARASEAAVAPGRSGFTEAVARSLHKLMAIKDEYEVARLYTDGAFAERLKAQFEGGYKLEFHLAPPLLARIDSETGRPRKRTFGGWMLPLLRLLARMKGLRGTPFDPFARTAERRLERALLRDYEERIERLLPILSAGNLALATAYAKVPDGVRGFGPVKAKNAEKARRDYARLEAQLFADLQDLARAAE
jgi:indolepyruvate ferredoxin oxidoreductase